MRKKIRRRKKNSRSDRLCITCIVVMLVGAMSVQIVKLYEKNLEYAATQESLEAELDDEQDRQTDLEDYKAYMGTQEYIEEIAKSKLGLVYNNEIIFKENN